MGGSSKEKEIKEIYVEFSERTRSNMIEGGIFFFDSLVSGVWRLVVQL